MASEISVSFYLSTIKKYWQFIAAVVCISALITGINVILTPRTYTSFVSVLVSSGGVGSSGSGTSTISRFLGIPNLAMGSSSKEVIGEIVKSRKMAEDIVTHFKLADSSNRSGWNSAVQKMRKKIDVPQRHGRPILEIYVSNRDPKKAADIANFCATNLDKINEELHITTEKPMVKVLDKAIVPDMSDPRGLKKKVIVSGMFSAIVSMLFLLLLEYMRIRKKAKE